MPSRKRAGGLLLGAHMSIAGGTPRAIERATGVRASVLQIFVKNNNRWKGKRLGEQEVTQFRQAWSDSGLFSIVAHDSYLINLASPQNELWNRSIEALLDELDRCERLGLSHLVTHPGSHLGRGEVQGVKRIARALDRVHEQRPDSKVKIALETTAGQGTQIGYRFAHLSDILAECSRPERLAVCLDTCHVFAAGYDLRRAEGYSAMIDEFDRFIGLDKLQLFHFNDSKRALGSRVDRHQHIGKGEIGLPGFGYILNDERFTRVPKILETPKSKTLDEDRRNLRTLRKLWEKGERRGEGRGVKTGLRGEVG